MNQLQQTDQHKLMLIMNEYEDVLDTVPADIFLTRDYCHIPSIYEVVFNAFPDIPTEDARIEAMQIMHRHHIFFRWGEVFSYVPIKEVW